MWYPNEGNFYPIDTKWILIVKMIFQKVSKYWDAAYHDNTKTKMT